MIDFLGMVRFSDPPVLLHDVIDDLNAVVQILERQAPYTPLGGWFRSGQAPVEPTLPMWFQNDWVHDTFAAEGSEVFLHHPRYLEAAARFYDAEVVEPQSVYVNLMAAIDGGGPAHTDNPRFHGRDRTNTPMWLLRTMLWSGLFEKYEILQATAIWWMHDVEGGAILYWADGPDRPPRVHDTAMANTALLGDNHGMFHQVGPVGPFDGEPHLITAQAELAPVGDGSGDWAVTDRGAVQYRAPLDAIRVSVLWKADVYRTEAERAQRIRSTLSLDDVADRFADDLASRDLDLRLDLARLDDLTHRDAFVAAYPEATPVDALSSG